MGGSDRGGKGGAPVGESGGVEGADVYDLLEVDVAVQQLLVAAVDDCGVVGGRKHVRRALGLERLQSDGLSAQEDVFPLRKGTAGRVHHKVEQVPVAQGAQQVRHLQGTRTKAPLDCVRILLALAE